MNQTHKTEVLFIIDHLDAGGGTQNILANLARGLGKLDYRLTVVSLNGGDRRFIQAMREEGVEVLAFNKTNLWFLGLPKVLNLIRKRKFPIIQNFLFYSNVIGRILGRIAGVPAVISSTWGDGRTFRRWEIWLDRLTNRLDDRIVVNSKAGYDFCLRKFRIKEEKVELIYNGIDMPESGRKADMEGFRKSCNIPAGKIIIGSIGRLSEEKGQRYLLDAFGMAAKEIDNLFLAIVGSGPLENDLKNQADRLNLGGKVVFIDYLEEVAPFYQLIDIFALSSLSEGLPNVILEAMFHEKPVIATSVGDVPEVVRNNVSGLLVPPGNPEELAEAMKSLARDKDLAGRLARQAREKVAGCFSIEKMVGSFDNLYKRSLR